jgi:hypothetical protein
VKEEGGGRAIGVPLGMPPANVGEGENVPRSAPKYGKLVLKAHKGMVLTDISNDLLRTPGVGDAGVGEDIRATVCGRWPRRRWLQR